MRRVLVTLLLGVTCLGLLLPPSVAATRPPAKKGAPVSPSDFPSGLLPGIKKLGVIPKYQYVIAFSNGDMNDAWRRTFVEDVIAWGKKYEDRFGVKFIFANSGNDSTKQLADVESLLAREPDLLLLSPNESTPLTVVKDLCERQKVPLICLDREIDAKPGTGMYKQIISMDYYLEGVYNGLAVVKYLTKKYGKPIGHVFETPGILGSSPGIQRSQGLRWVLKDYPDIRIIDSRTCNFDRKQGYEVIQDALEKYPAGMIDCIVAGCDEGGLGGLQAVKEKNRKELIGAIISTDGIREALEGIAKGEVFSSAECTPYYGMIAMEYAIRLLNGENIPARVMLPERCWDATTPERLKILKSHIEYMQKNNLSFVPVEVGGHQELAVPEIAKIYKNWWESPEEQAVKPFTTQPPLPNWPQK